MTIVKMLDVLSVYITPGTSKERLLEAAHQKALENPNGLANVCFHKKGRRHNKRCYTLDINETMNKKE